ncbi:hypothetical protein GFS24_23420 [Chitinophaga sp. SYP-B3965]|uniref:hypothetical protein n=1 Tax=Chitinophaga sp. SYP-B3965 TaxID=2663120 RepID=UPI001299A287|nr:hypothetical protein [Chitinophaga sp. SYP-B3965]MRG48089.1 hypothetical protein [Chitinophaga sp. SYP-B3965]
MIKGIALLMVAITLSMNATSGIKTSNHAPAFAWNFIYAFGNGPVSGLSWSGNYLYISSGNYTVYSANGYGFLTPSTPVYVNAVDNANTYVQVSVTGTSGPVVSYYDFQDF